MSSLLETLSLVGFNWHVALANLINIAIIFVILKKLIFDKLSKTLDKRNKIIEEGVSKSKKADDLLHEANTKSSRMLDEARANARTIIDNADRDKKSLIEETRKQLNVEIEERRLSLNNREAKMAEEMLADFQANSRDLVASLVAKAIKNSHNKEANDSLIIGN